MTTDRPAPAPRLAALDIGTNSRRLVVAESGRLSDAAIAGGFEATELRAIATSAGAWR